MNEIKFRIEKLGMCGHSKTLKNNLGICAILLQSTKNYSTDFLAPMKRKLEIMQKV